MPFGIRKDPGGGADIDFDAIYEQAIRPAIQAAGMEPLRADEEFTTSSGLQKTISERLLLSDFAVADVTMRNPQVFFDLIARNALRPGTTLAIFARNEKLPLDAGDLRVLAYDLADGNRFTTREAVKLRRALTRELERLRESAPDFSALETGSRELRKQTLDAAEKERAIAGARDRKDAAALAKIEREIGDLEVVDASILLALFLAYQALGLWERMVDFGKRLPKQLRSSAKVRTQLGLALNRLRRRDEAIATLQDVLREHGPDSEVLGILGRVYKDAWFDATANGNTEAPAYLDKSIECYMRGFEADRRNPYPGINAVTLLDIRGNQESLNAKTRILPMVRMAVMDRLKSSKRPEYWDYATLLELAVLQDDRMAAREHLNAALGSVSVAWEAETTAYNLTLIREARRRRVVQQDWLDEIIDGLQDRVVA